MVFSEQLKHAHQTAAVVSSSTLREGWEEVRSGARRGIDRGGVGRGGEGWKGRQGR